jgi:glycosyltransferase involved in cell wall biosynthesis
MPRRRSFIRKVMDTVMKWSLGPALYVAARLSRASSRPIDVGLGPDPLVNNIYHRRALERHGFTAETFARTVFFVTGEFDFRADKKLRGPLRPFIPFYLFLRSLVRYRTLYLYFNGGPLHTVPGLWRWEPTLLRAAGIKTVVMPYGSDVHDMRRCRNPAFAAAMRIDYPGQLDRADEVAQRVRLWSEQADHVISGCDWIDYMDRWDTLTVGHFSIDTEDWTPPRNPRRRRPGDPFRILHAPNHRAIKGTQFFVAAVDTLRAEGENVELLLLEGVPNHEVRTTMEKVDLVADQLIVGWYAMFAIEAMALGLPVLCYLREAYLRAYREAGLIDEAEVPLINCCPETVTDTLRRVVHDPEERVRAGRRGRAYVERHHSLEAVGARFARIQCELGVEPRETP